LAKKIQSIDKKQLLDSYSDSGLHVSSLTASQFKYVALNKPGEVISILPELPKFGDSFKNFSKE
jgi:hypothetical protein